MSYLLVAGGSLALACGQPEGGGALVGVGLFVWFLQKLSAHW